MPRSNWKGVISFGLVSIPVVLYTSRNKSADISFHQIDRRNNARIKYQRINVETGKPVDWEDITRGYEYAKDEVVPVPDEVLKRVAGDNSRIIDIETFINKDDLDVVTIENTYYLIPDKKGEKGYVILREALRETNKIGIAKIIISTKEYLAAVMPYEKALIVCLLRYDNEIRKLSEFDVPDKELKAYKVSTKEIDIARQLIKSMTSKWKPEKYGDEYQEAVHKWVEETVKDLPQTPMKQRKHGSETQTPVNFVDLLKKSLASGNKPEKKTTKKTKFAKPPRGKERGRHATRH